MHYDEFIKSKEMKPVMFGHEPGTLSDVLYDFQKKITAWAIRRGRAAIFADCGLGKTLMQLEWARQSGERVLIVSPLAVSEQTINEARKLRMDVYKISDPPSKGEVGFFTTNYEKLHRFVGSEWDAIVLDESSILKSLDGKTRTMLIREFTGIQRRLCCTATPAPNDMAELANHSEFLGVMPRVEMLATYFVHDSDGAGAGSWRLKGHARDAFWRWLAKWAVYIRRPSDIDCEDGDFVLNDLNIKDEVVSTDWKPEGMLFAADLGGIGERRRARKNTLNARVERAAKIIRRSNHQWLVWCGLNAEGDELEAALGKECVQIAGCDKDEDKIEKESLWRSGLVRVMITKPSIFGWGMNWQHCQKMMFLGLGDSYEQYYQAIRRCWRFGQKEEVDVLIVVSEAEMGVADNVRSKERVAEQTANEVIQCSREAIMEEIGGGESKKMTYMVETKDGDGWKMMLGDCVERIKEVKTGSVALSVFSPPFASLYTYSASERDMGNSKNYEQFFKHFGYLIPEIQRVTMPGRRCCVHVQQVTTTKVTHGVIGWRDFRADVVRAFILAGWVYDGEVVIDKDPQAQAIRTKSKALMFVQKDKDSSWIRPAMADYILCFRHPGENTILIKPDVTNDEWIMWARPIWYNIRESDTLNAACARTEKDERHICPLQLETIERCVRLWTNPGETVFSPFAGIGSEGYVSLQKERKFVGIELKREYYQQAVANLGNAKRQTSMF